MKLFTTNGVVYLLPTRDDLATRKQKKQEIHIMMKVKYLCKFVMNAFVKTKISYKEIPFL